MERTQKRRYSASLSGGTGGKLNGWLKALVALTCIMLIAAIAWWGLQQYKAAQHRMDLEAFRKCEAAQALKEGMTPDLARSMCQLFWSDYR